ncbi:MAG: sigma-70 family RNA polymerase sigma factor [Verrucomicrobiales bacterium]
MLGEIADGKAAARDELVSAVYEQLRKIAQVRMNAERPDHTLQATALVHEAYLRLERDLGGALIRNRSDFFGAAAEAMRRILIDHARRRGSLKRGGGWRKVPIQNVADLAETADPDQILAVDEAYQILTVEQPLFAEVVRLRFFGGLSVEETAEVLGISPPTVKRRWRLARAMLHDIFEKISRVG